MADSKHEETFKVIDRRHFTGDGELRPEVVEMERREQEAAAKETAAKKASAAASPSAKPAANAQPNPTTKSGANPGAGSGAAAAAKSAIIDPESAYSAGEKSGSTWISPESGESAPSEPTHSSHSFQMLVDFLTRNAAAMLGGMADPRTGQPFVDLEGAREVIDMLDALREKTRGNLSKEDDQLLIEVLGSLKLTFMDISKAAAEAMAKKAKGSK